MNQRRLFSETITAIAFHHGPIAVRKSSEKIRQIEEAAVTASVELGLPLKVWRTETCRNAIFQSDYSLHGDEVRLKIAARLSTRR